MEELIEEYKSSLEDLKFNSKPHINMLTILAEENKQHAEHIVRIIEERIAKAAVRLPILYLLDSIVKNVGGNYKLLFAKKLNTTFKLAFEAANDKEKMSLYKLRTTWDDYFPLKKLHSLDLTIQALDPNWPVKPLPAHLQTNATKNIHVNPKFLKTNESGSSSSATVTTKTTAKSVPKPTSISSSNAPTSEMDVIKQRLVKQQKELLDLQQKKLLLELEQTKKQLAAQRDFVKSQEKASRDSRSHPPTSGAPGNLRVTLSNSKASVSAGQAPGAMKDPRLKSVNKKVSPDSSKTTSKVVVAKKKKSPEKKERSSPDVTMSKNKAAKPSVVKQLPEKKTDGVIKKPKKTVSEDTANGNNLSSNEVEYRKKRAHRGKSSVSPPPTKILKRASPPRRPTETLMAPTSKVRNELPRDPRRNRMDRNRRVNALKDQSKDSSRSSEGSLSPRFSPEPDSDDVMSTKPPERMRFNRRNDALMRRPSFDPDLHIPQELTLGHQNEILRQANHQLNSGQLTHEQHQELLKQLHQLFEVQRMKKMQGTEGVPPRGDPVMRERGRSPVDPRQLKKRNTIPKESAELEKSRRPGRDQVPEDYHGMHRPMPEKRRLSTEPFRKDGDSHSNRVTNLPPGEQKFHPDQSLPPPKRRNRRPNFPRDVRHPLPSPNSDLARPAMRDGRPFPRPPLRGPIRPSEQPPRLPPSFPHDVNESRPHDPRHGSPPRMSPPHFHPSGEKGRGRNTMADDGKQKNLRRFAHADAQTNDKARSHRRDDPRRKPRNSKSEPNQPAKPAISQNIDASEKSALEEPEDYIIANIPPHAEETENKLEEPEDFIIAEMNTAIQKRKDSCEEPEDFIIAEMPFDAESSCSQSTGIKRTTESEQAYLEHMKKIKQSMYTKEREANKRSSLSDNIVTTEGSSSEKSSAENETVPKKDEVSKSPSLPLKKRRYVSSEKSTATDNSKTPEPVAPNKDSSLKVPEESGKERNVEKKEVEPTKPLKIEVPVKPEPETKSIVSEEKKSDKKIEKSKKKNKNVDKPKQQGKPKSDPVPHREDKPKTEAKTIEQINNDESSLIYVIDDEEPASGDARKSEPENVDKRAKMRHRKLRPKEWRREADDEEARLQMLMEDEKKQLEWEGMLQRELEIEQWKEDRMRRGQLGRGRGVRLPPPERWESPPRDMQEPVPFDIARGRLSRDRLHRPRPLRHDIGPPRRERPFPRDEMRSHRPMNDMRRPPSPVEFRGPPPPPGWDRRRLSPPPRPHPRDERLPEWDRPMGRLPPPPPREPPYLPDDHRPPVDDRDYHLPMREAPQAAPAINQVNVNKLLTDLVVMGIIPGSKKADSKSSSPVPPQSAPEPTKQSSDPPPALKVEPAVSPAAVEKADTRSVSPFIEEDLMMLDPDARIPTVSLSSDLKKRHEEIVKRIYTGIQCSACGLRFTTRQTDLYADHLDWHYRANKKDKNGTALFHREFYPSAGDWITYEEIENPQDKAKHVFLDDKEDGEGEPLNGNTPENELTVPLTGKPGEDKCKVCNEAFETFYNETDDEWQFARCVKVDGDNFHPNCYGDHCELTPLPAAMQTPLYNPLDGGDGIPGLDTSLANEGTENTNESEKEENNERSAEAIAEDATVPSVDDATSKMEEIKEAVVEDSAEKAALQTSSHEPVEEDVVIATACDSSTKEEPKTVDKIEEENKDVVEAIAEDATVPSVDDATSQMEEIKEAAVEDSAEKVPSPDVIVVDESPSPVKLEDVATETEDVAPKDILTETNDLSTSDDVETT